MLELISILELAMLGTAAFTDVQMRLSEPVVLPERGNVAVVEFMPGNAVWAKTHDCRFRGLVVPFTRDWDEVSGGSENQVVRPAEPDKLAGYAFLVNKLNCPGEAPQFLFNAGQRFHAIPAGTKVPARAMVVATFNVSQNLDLQPKWLPQVMKVVEASSASSAAAKDFLDFNAASAEAAKAKKQSLTAQSQ